MSFCSNCGAENENGAKFCFQCGSNINQHNIPNSMGSSSKLQNYGINNQNAVVDTGKKKGVLLTALISGGVILILIIVLVIFLVSKNSGGTSDDLGKIVETVYEEDVITEEKTDEKVEDVAEEVNEYVEFNPFDHLTVNFVGNNFLGKIDFVPDLSSPEMQSIEFKADRTNELINGENITVTVKMLCADKDFAERYGSVVTEFEKDYEVEGLHDYVSDYNSIPQKNLDEIKQKAEEVFWNAYGNEDKFAKPTNINNISCIGYYLMNLNPKTIDKYTSRSGLHYNKLYLIYEINASDGESSSSNNYKYYYYVAFTNLVMSSPEKISVDLEYFERPILAYFYVNDVPHLCGYSDLDSLYAEAISGYQDKYAIVSDISADNQVAESVEEKDRKSEFIAPQFEQLMNNAYMIEGSDLYLSEEEFIKKYGEPVLSEKKRINNRNTNILTYESDECPGYWININELDFMNYTLVKKEGKNDYAIVKNGNYTISEDSYIDLFDGKMERKDTVIAVWPPLKNEYKNYTYKDFKEIFGMDGLVWQCDCNMVSVLWYVPEQGGILVGMFDPATGKINKFELF